MVCNVNIDSSQQGIFTFTTKEMQDLMLDPAWNYKINKDDVCLNQSKLLSSPTKYIITYYYIMVQLWYIK